MSNDKIENALDAYEAALAKNYDEGGEDDHSEEMASARQGLLDVLRKLQTDSEILDYLDDNFFHRSMDDLDQKIYKNTSMWVFFAPTKAGGYTARQRLTDAMKHRSGPSLADMVAHSDKVATPLPEGA